MRSSHQRSTRCGADTMVRKPESNESNLRQQAKLENALVLLRRGEARSTSEGLEQLAQLAAVGFEPALTSLLSEVLNRRLADRVVRSVLLDPADIEDAVQSTLIAVADKISTFEGRSRFSTWLHRVAHNEALMVVRRRSRKNEPVSNQLPETDLSAKRLSSMIADQETVHAALQQLSPGHREILHLREDLEMSYEEIATRLAVPVNTVRSRISRARRSLFDLLLGRACH